MVDVFLFFNIYIITLLIYIHKTNECLISCFKCQTADMLYIYESSYCATNSYLSSPPVPSPTPASLFVHPSVCLPKCLYVCMYVCQSIKLLVRLSVPMSACPIKMAAKKVVITTRPLFTTMPFKEEGEVPLLL